MGEIYRRDPQPHERNERVTVFWPSGPYDFVIEFHRAEPSFRRGWLWLRGFVVEPKEPQFRRLQTFFVRPVEGGYTLLGDARLGE